MLKKAVQIGNPIVRRRSRRVDDLKSKAVKNIVKNLVDSMRHYRLVGMAAPQIGSNLRIFVSEIRKTKTRNPKFLDALRVFINPVITHKSKKRTVLFEGCGSLDFGNIFGPVKRPSRIEVAAYDETGRKFILKAGGLLAKIIQHETDHLDGIICIDKFTDTKQIQHKAEWLKKKS